MPPIHPNDNNILFIFYNRICALVREIFLEQPMFLELGAPVNVVGDTHGQFVDLLRIFDLCGYPP